MTDDRPPDKPSGWVPRPPKPTTAADFIVICFAVTVATILVLLAIGIVIAGILGQNIAPYFAVLTDIMTTLIGSLVGYLAGKASGRAEGPGPS